MKKQEPTVENIEALFNKLFKKTENTLLISGGEEPVYLPASKTGDYNKIVSTKDYYSSALHEVSHWCLAGSERRKLIDYGYWYEPDGRTEEQQGLFEKVEIKPQALEWIFTKACNQKFRLSVDNVNQPDIKASNEFQYNVYVQVMTYLQEGVPERAKRFLDALLNFFKPSNSFLKSTDFQLVDLCAFR